jgi:crotonobetainyl-CoA:carnitine CoA-transferase CaiB-like acyl-CoA transferase
MTRNPTRELPLRAPGGGIRLLEGVRILDLTTSIAGPYATMLLSDLGAEVVKIERPGSGDDSRHWGPPFLDGRSLWHASVNRNKLSVALDYRLGGGREVFEDLVAASDAVVTNQLPAVSRRLGTDYETLKALRPGLVYVSLTGFGAEGARTRRPCYDIIAEGFSGVMDVTGEAENDPQKIGTPAADLLAGHDAAMACIAGLFDAARSGKSHFVDVSMVDSMTRLMSPRITVYLGSGEVPRRTGAKDSVIAVYQTFATADGMITLALPNDTIWQRFWDTVGRAEYGLEPRFATNAQRQAARPEIIAAIEEILGSETTEHWLARFEEARIPAGPINSVDVVTRDAELIRRGLFFGIETAGEPVPQVGLGIQVDGADAGYRAPPPELGEHSEQVLTEILGYDDRRVAALKDEGII